MASAQTLVRAQSGTIGRTITLNATVTQAYTVAGYNAVTGTVTARRDPGEVSAGEVLYRVDQRPVVAAVGLVPFYRPLALGAQGQDVTQLRSFLRSEGFLRGSSRGVFGEDVVGAVRAWQGSLGVDQTGVVGLGDLMAFAQLPVAVQISQDLKLGALASPGQAAVSTRAAEPQFTMTLTADQVALVPSDAQVGVRHEGGVWPAVLGNQRQDSDGTTIADLTATGGGLVCGQECDQLPDAEQSSLLADVTISPQVSGILVPVAAVRQDADGATYVATPTGRKGVQVRGSDNGMAVVDGITEGTQLQVDQGSATQGSTAQANS